MYKKIYKKKKIIRPVSGSTKDSSFKKYAYRSLVLGYGLAFSANAIKMRFQLTNCRSSLIFMLCPRNKGFDISFVSDCGCALKLLAKFKILWKAI